MTRGIIKVMATLAITAVWGCHGTVPSDIPLEVRKKQKADICMAKHMEEVPNRTSNHKITKGKKLMNIEIRGKSLTKK